MSLFCLINFNTSLPIWTYGFKLTYFKCKLSLLWKQISFHRSTSHTYFLRVTFLNIWSCQYCPLIARKDYISSRKGHGRISRITCKKTIIGTTLSEFLIFLWRLVNIFTYIWCKYDALWIMQITLHTLGVK